MFHAVQLLNLLGLSTKNDVHEMACVSPKLPSGKQFNTTETCTHSHHCSLAHCPPPWLLRLPERARLCLARVGKNAPRLRCQVIVDLAGVSASLLRPSTDVGIDLDAIVERERAERGELCCPLRAHSPARRPVRAAGGRTAVAPERRGGRRFGQSGRLSSGRG